MRTLTSVEAQNRFGELLDSAQREPIAITRHGRTAAYVVSGEVYQQLVARAAGAPDAERYLQAIAAFRGQGAGGGSARLLADRRDDAQR